MRHCYNCGELDAFGTFEFDTVCSKRCRDEYETYEHEPDAFCSKRWHGEYETYDDEPDGQPDEAQEWHDFDPDC